jgi:hypothetical protein
MTSKALRRVSLFGLVAGLMTLSARGAAPDERTLWKLWVRHTNNVADHAGLVAACREFVAQSPQDPLGAVARGLEGWHLLQDGKQADATRVFEALATAPPLPDPLAAAGADMAKTWLTRLDREAMRAALKQYYRQKIEFPARLDALRALKGLPVPPFSDRWGQAWGYRLESAIKGMAGQQYVLESTRLGNGSDLGKALALPYAAGIRLSPSRLIAAGEGEPVVEFAVPSNKPVVLSVGGTAEGVTAAFIGPNLIILSDGDHWQVLPKPR